MTTYRGTVTITMSGVAQGYGPFSASVPVTAELWNATLTPDGVLWATLDGNGPLTVSVGGTTVTDFLTLPSTPFSTPIAAPALPFSESVPGLTIVWNETNAFNAQRTAVTTTGAGNFTGTLQGVTVSGTINAAGTLVASSSAYSIAAASAAKAEGGAGSAAFTFTVTRLGATGGLGTIPWRVTANPADGASATDFDGFTMPEGTLTFLPGETTKTLTVGVLGDGLVEGDEGFTVALANGFGEVIAVASEAQGTILNDDVSLLSVEAVQADRAEGNDFPGTDFTFVVRHEGSTAEGASVGWSVVGSGPVPVTTFDFPFNQFPSGVVTFLPGEASHAVTLTAGWNSSPEPHKSFSVVLSNPSGGVIGRGEATGLIINDDGGSAQVADSTVADERFDLGDGWDLARFSAPRAQSRVGVLGDEVRVEGPDGRDELAGVEWLKFGTEPAITLETLRGQPGTDELMRFLTTGPSGTQLTYALPLAYSGPLDLAYLYPGTDLDDVVAGTSRNDFMNLAGGNDAAYMGAGDDIVDGGGGNNFLTGAAGRDSFFLDGRFAVPVWSCITDWEVGESLVLWGWRPGVSAATWGENAGLPGYLGATLYADIDGNGLVETAVTWTGQAVAQIPTGQVMEVSGIGVLKFG